MLSDLSFQSLFNQAIVPTHAFQLQIKASPIKKIQKHNLNCLKSKQLLNDTANPIFPKPSPAAVVALQAADLVASEDRQLTYNTTNDLRADCLSAPTTGKLSDSPQIVHTILNSQPGGEMLCDS